MGLLEFYHGLEDAWYGFLDNVEKMVPVYAVVDPIERIVPTFAILAGIAAVLITGIGFSLFSGALSGSSLTLLITDGEGNPVEGASIHATWGNGFQDAVSSGVGKTTLKGLPSGKEITIQIERSTFASFTKKYTLNENNPSLSIVLLPKILPPAEMTFYFVDKSGMSLEGKNIQVELSCSSGTTWELPTRNTADGVLKITPPAGCDTALGSISGEGLESENGLPLLQRNPIIVLSTRIEEKSMVKVHVQREEDQKALNGMSVELFSKEGLSVETRFTNSLGVTLFENVSAGEYYMSASDPSGEFTLSTQTNVIVDPPQGALVEMALKRETQGSIVVSVTDKDSHAALSNATIKLVRKSDHSLLLTRLVSAEETSVTLSVDEKGPFLLYATHPEYLSEEKDIGTIGANSSVTFALEKLTAQNSGRVLVHVVDEENVPVDNALVVIYDAASKFIAQQYSPKTTNASGDASFVGIQSGNYFARVMKFPAGSSDSANFTSNKNELTNVNATLKLGTATLRVRVTDEQGEPVPFATVEFRTDGSNECANGACVASTDVLGVANQSFKADRKVYARVTSGGFLPYTTQSYSLRPNLPVMVPVTLVKTITGNAPRVSLMQVLDSSTGLPAQTISPGKGYRFVFQLRIPSEAVVFEHVGAHVRVGEEALLENENASISSVTAPQTSITRGTSYQPNLGFTDGDEENLTNGDAMWANVEWNTASPGVYEFSSVIYVNGNASLLEDLKLFYRAWGTLGSIWTRDPFDAQLNENEEISGKESQYAEAYSKVYQLGKPLACNDAVCYGGESVLNLDTGLFAKNEPFPIIPLNEYRYSFVLAGGNNAALNDARIKVFSHGDNSTLNGPVFTSYTFANIPGTSVSQTGLSVHEITGESDQGIAIGTISAQQTVSGTLEFTGSSSDDSEIVIQLISEGDVVFERTLELIQTGFQNFSISASPENAPAYVPTVFTVHVTDADGFDVAGARIRITKTDSSNAQTVIAEQYTDIFGQAVVDTPSSLPGTKFVIDASRGEESGIPLVLMVTQGVAAFDPDELEFTLDAVPNGEQFLPLDMKNITQGELVLKQTVITGDFQGLLSTNDMQNWLNQYHGNTHITPNTTKTIQVKASMPESFFLLAGKNLSGNMVVFFQNADGSSTWVQTIPMRFTLTIPNQCDGEAIQLSGVPSNGSLEVSSFDNRMQQPFQLLNICEVNGQALDLHNLQAKINWKSAPIGNVELSIVNPADGTQTVEALQNGFNTPLFDTFNTANQTPYEAVLTFTPFPRHVGETAEFTVAISAQTGQGNETELVSQSFDMKIKVTNFESCIAFDVDRDAGLQIRENESETQFSIDTSACGDVPIDIEFCAGAGNANCIGGAPEGKIYLSQTAIHGLKGNKTIRVERKTSTLPGTYDITVDARVAGTTLQRIAALSLTVEEKLSYAFDVEKTDFSVFTQGAVDSSAVTNRLVEEKVKVRASICDWDDSNGRDWSILWEGIGGYWILHDFDFDAAWDAFWDLFNDPCDEHDDGVLMDFVVKLAKQEGLAFSIASDAIDIQLSPNIPPEFQAEWVTEEADVSKVDGKLFENVGLKFTNMGGFSSGLPLFGVMTLRAKEHVHGDEFHAGNGNVHCDNGNFGKYRIGAASDQGDCSGAFDRMRTEKYHIKINTKDIQPVLQPTTFDGVACESPNMMGVTGATALPRVAFKWNWDEQTGVSAEMCDAANPNAVYCDAVQFNIMMQKRLKILDEFLAANQYNFECPSNLGTTPESGVFTRPAPVPIGFIGFHSFGYSFQGPTVLSFSGTIENSTATSQDAAMLVALVPLPNSSNLNAPLGEAKSCTANTFIIAGGQQVVQCSIIDVVPGLYNLTFDLSSGTTANIASVINTKILDTESYQTGFGNTCGGLIKTTMIIDGKPGINRWMDASDPQWGNTINDHPIFTADVPNVEALRKLTHFDAYLMQEGYSTDFENDFRDYYSTSAFADAPAWFKGNANGTAGFNSYYGNDDVLKFTQKYFDSPLLSVSGKYRVDLDVTYSDEWNFLDASGQPAATAKVVFYQIENPSPDSPFYDMPFDGAVGLEGNEYHRIGYGMEYTGAGDLSLLTDEAPLKSGSGSSAVRKLNIIPQGSVQRMNSIPSTRGSVLDISAQQTSLDYLMQFSPSLATPLVMKVTHAESEVPFSAFYEMDEGSMPVNTGNTFTFWEGAGNCYDYTGVPAYEKFNYSPDRHAVSTDGLPDFQSAYGIDWPRAVVGGDEYLRTILYTPVQESFSFQTRTSSNRVLTANDATPSTSQLLDGISSMPLNNASSQIHTIQDVFALVASQSVCVSNSGTQTRFFWNPAAVYSTPGQMNVSTYTNGLVAGQTCLGPPE